MKRIFRVTIRDDMSGQFMVVDFITITGKDIMEICQIAAKNEKVWISQALDKARPSFEKPVCQKAELAHVE